MDPEIKRLLEESLAIEKDNNAILRSMRHHQWLSFLTSIVFWVVVVALPLYLYQQYFQPVLDKFTGTGTNTGTFSMPTSAELQKLIDSFKAGQTGQ